MNCPNELKLIAFVGEELSALESSKIVEHAKTCKKCKTEIAELTNLRGLLKKGNGSIFIRPLIPFPNNIPPKSINIRR